MRVIHGRKKLFLYGMGGMGVNMLNLIVGSYLCDALMVEGFDKNVEMWTYANKTLVVAAVWSVMILIAKIIDGVIDIPFATFTDNLKSRWGRRRPAILMGLVPMLLCYIGFLNPVSANEHSLGNTIWFGVMLCLFYAFYTLTMCTYYATFSEIVATDEDRVTLSNYKTIFDVIYFILGYGLIPLLISSSINIRIIGYIFTPLALTMLIPVFMIKEESTKKGAPTANEDEHVGLIMSFKYCVTNKSFMLWMVVYAALQFGLQMFIAGQNVYYSGTMKFEGWQITVMMAAVFVPVPATLVLYNRIVKKRGLTAGFAFSLCSFAVAMVFMALSRPEVFSNEWLRMVVAIIGCVCASFGIGCFFSIGYTIPSALADIEYKQKGISHPAMYFAVQGLFSGVATAVATGLVWVNIKAADCSWLLPILVFAASALAVGLTFLLPKDLGNIGKTENREEAPAAEPDDISTVPENDD